MKTKDMTSMERVLTTLSHKEPDRVPLFLLATMHGAKELGMSIKDYFAKGENVAEGQLRINSKYHTDCLYPFFYAPLETEAFGGDVIFTDDGPPNSGIPLIKDIEKINCLQAPKVKDTKVLHKVLKSIQLLKEKAKGETPIIGVVMSPFSLPVLQLGFEKYLDIIHFRKDMFNHLMQVNQEFCIDWANAQLEAGATAICYFDPVSSSTIIPRELYLETGLQIAKQTIAQIKGPTATHFASGNCLPISDLVSQTGTAVVGVSSNEDIGVIKNAFKDKLTVLGNLNGVEMRRWTREETHRIVRDIIQKAAPSGGFILSDNHGEIPFQVPDEVLLTISETVQTFGVYPITKKQQ
ncbi:MAG: methylcobamide--CoM methyltransferase MtbA [Bacteroidales bacterium]|nr:MAG: methylcobamide--CoM methyltransferase MtbA [Bacteroidales bacterium]